MTAFSIFSLFCRRAAVCVAVCVVVTLLATGASMAQSECRDEAKVLVSAVSFPDTTLAPDAEATLKARLTGRCFDPSHIQEMRQRLQDGLESLGYLHGAIGEPKLEYLDRNSQPKRVAVTFPVDEGAQYTVESVQWEGVNNLTPVQMESMIEMHTGDTFDSSKVRRAVARIRSLYDANGYKKTRVIPETLRNDSDHNVAVTFKVEEGEK